jgi:type VI secretion system protein VasG
MNRERFFGRLGRQPYDALIEAHAIGKAHQHSFVDLEHWMLALLQRPSSDLHLLALEFGLDVSLLQQKLKASLARQAQSGNTVRDFSAALERSVSQALTWNQVVAPSAHVRSGHLLLAWLEESSTLRWLGSLADKFARIDFSEWVAFFEAEAQGWDEARDRAIDGPNTVITGLSGTETSTSTSASADQGLARWASCLTQQASQGELDPVVGRDAELRTVIDVLLRRRQNNAILVGEAGVGKTAVAEALAQRIHAQSVPAALQSAQVWALDLGRMKAGAGARGEFEQRLRSVVDAIQASEAPIILFCDEAHTLVGAGGAAGTGDAVNLLKPMLARGQLRMIAATTWSEFKQFFEPDAALTRRFQAVPVEEPDDETALAMMRVTASKLAEHHGVRIADSALVASVKLSRRHLPARQLPDKSISLLDTACARVAMSQTSAPAALDSVRQQLLHVEQALQWQANDRQLGLGNSQEALEQAELLQQKFSLEQQLDQLQAAVQLSKAQVRDFLSQLGCSEQAPDALSEQTTQWVQPWVSARTIAEVLAEWTGIPCDDLDKDDAAGALQLQHALCRVIHGQDEALRLISQTLQINAAGLNEPERPLGVFLLAGPTGTGKSQTAKALAEQLFGSARHLVQFNMNEFQEAHTVSTLKGSPPGYVGFGKGGRLTEAVRQRPYSVLLLDEFDRAHRDVHEMFYQVFDQGWMDDGEGRRISFRNCLILLTTNLGDSVIEAACAADPQITQAKLTAQTRELIQTQLDAPLLARMELVAYRPLDLAALQAVAQTALLATERRLMAQGVSLELAPDVAPWIAQAVLRHPARARAVQDLVRQHVVPVMARAILAARAKGDPISRVRLDAENGLSVSFGPPHDSHPELDADDAALSASLSTSIELPACAQPVVVA